MRTSLLSVMLLACLFVSCNDSGNGDGDEFQSSDNWGAFDASAVGGLPTRGYFGAAYDGRYIYYAPIRAAADYHGITLRYDTQSAFGSAASWESYDAGNTQGLNTKGYSGAVHDGRYIYYVPFSADARHARVLRFDTQGGFGTASSWSAHDAKAEAGSQAAGYSGGVFDGRYVYFAPYGYPPYAHAIALRLDTQGDFQSSSSWGVYNAGSTDGMTTKGYYGCAFDGRYVYYAPFNDGSGYHGRALRYDTQGAFTDGSRWSAYNAAGTDGLNTIGYKGVICQGRYVYFVPFRDDADGHGRVLRYDRDGDFRNAGSWRAFDVSGTDGLDTRGYLGACSDGRFIYFCPYSIGEQNYHGSFLRYDSESEFADSSSWSAFAPGTINGMNIKGYKGAVFDGTYVYYVPYFDGSLFHGYALRFRAR